MLRVIKQSRPSWVVCENVAGHVKLGLDEVLSNMEDEDYSGVTFNIPACAKGAKHKRERLWIVFHTNSPNAPRIRRPLRQDKNAPIGEATENVKEGNRGFFKLVSGAATPREPSYSESLRKLDGIPYRMDRLKGLGNAIVPQIAYEIFRNIKECSRRTKKEN